MITDPISAEDINYNAITGCFEAKVTVHGVGSPRMYACEVESDMSLSYADAEKALRAEASRRHKQNPGLYSSEASNEPLPFPSLQDRPKATTGWAAYLPHFGGQRAA